MANESRVNQRTFSGLNKFIKKMDFFRYLILYKYGGIYADLDFIMKGRIPDEVLKHDFIGYKACRNRRKDWKNKAYWQNDHSGRWVLGQAFFGCKGGHEGLKYTIKDIATLDPEDQKLGPVAHTGPEKINKIFVKKDLLYDEGTFIFPKSQMADPGRKGSLGNHQRCSNWIPRNRK